MSHNRKIIYLAGFLFSLPLALMAYINSSFLSSFIGEKLVGITYILGSVISILLLLTAPLFFKKLGAYKFLLLLIGLDALSILAFALTKSALVVIIAFIFGFALNVMIVFSLDEILKILSKNSSMGGTRGAYIAIVNLAWIFSQLIFVFSGKKGIFSFRMIYLIAFWVMISLFLLVFFALKEIADPKYDSIK